MLQTSIFLKVESPRCTDIYKQEFMEVKGCCEARHYSLVSQHPAVEAPASISCALSKLLLLYCCYTAFILQELETEETRKESTSRS